MEIAVKYESCLATNLISKVDKCILSFFGRTHLLKENIDVVLTEFQKTILQFIYGLEQQNLEIRSIFDDQISNTNKRFIGICLLRLWSANEDVFTNDRAFQHKVIRLFDTVFENNLYKLKEINIKNGDQTFEKANKLKDFVKSLEEKLIPAQNYSLDTVGSIEGYRKVLLSSIRGTELKNILPYFLPKEYNSIIDNLFSRIKEYTTSGSDDKIAKFNAVCADVENALHSTQLFQTSYKKILLDDVCNKLLSIIQQDFNNSPYSKPAILRLEATNKKYPFAQLDYDFKLGLFLANCGEGHAYNVNITIDDLSEDLEVDREKFLGLVKFDDVLIEFQCKMAKPAKDIIIVFTVQWENFDKTQCTVTEEFLLHGQRDDINWDKFKHVDFYSTEAVESEDELVGRREILNSLTARIEGKRVGSFYVYGQRRVGKSSIVKTLKTELEKSSPEDNIVFYQETGDYKDPNPNTTINQLAKNICDKIRNFDLRLSHLPIPEFRGALSPISGYLTSVSEILPRARILIILDEFDKIPVELYRKGEIGDSFFDTIRAISNKGPYGFLLVGGERMEYIMRDQSQEVNKFKSIRVDYFNKNSHWQDFRDLVINPIHDSFEVNDDGISYLYDQTAGNPFFTKVICEEMMVLMVARKDNHITLRDIIEAKEKAVENCGEQIFAHFWKDGIRDLIVSETEVSTNRRKLLIGIVNVLTLEKELTEINIIDEAIKLSLSESTAHSTLKEFIDRDVLTQTGELINFKVLFFRDWLTSGGVDKLRTTLVESDRLAHELLSSRLAEVRSEELVSLVAEWGPYRGQEVTTDKVRGWLKQFGENGSQRLMFKILQNLHFYSDFEITTKMRQIYSTIRKTFVDSGNIRTIIGREFTRKDIVVSYLEDTPAKSGSEYAKIFAEENDIFYKNIMSSDKLERYIEKNKNIHSIIFVDDFIGSGTSALENIVSLIEQYPRVFTNPDINLHYGVVCGYQEAKHKIFTRMKRLKVNLTVHVCDILDDSDRIFENESKIFTPAERHKARAICYDKGSFLVKNNALGFNNSQSIIVFPRTIPNNSLPVLWAENKEWKALFLRPL